jgi:thiol-disulfide isomerase/thioredoxin
MKPRGVLKKKHRSQLINFILLCILSVSLSTCIVVPDQYSGLPPGPWRAVLKLESRPVMPNPDGRPLPDKVNVQFEEVTEGELPFNFEVIYDSEDAYHIEIINGRERIRVDDISLGRRPSRARDTVRINFPVFDTYIDAFYEENIIEGQWVSPNRGGSYTIPFVARHGRDHRFTTLRKEPFMDISGKWEAYFEVETDSPYKAIGEFEQDGNYLTGTFLTETGDYRYLEGTVQADKVYLSVFDGSHAFLFEAKILPDSTMIGSFRSGIHYQTTWEAKRNPEATLRSGEKLTYLKEGYDGISFSFPNPEGQMISLEDERYKGKVKILQLMGTWCPNCRDEVNFLLEYLQEKNTDELAVIGLAFERYPDEKRAMGAIRNYKKRMEVPYEMVWAGSSDKEEAAKALPMLNDIIAFPTLIVLDRDDKVRWIQTGFTGPATSQFQVFKNKFDAIINELITD